MKMVSMARKAEKEKETDVPCCGEESKYPYGLQISLEEDQLQALGLAEMPKTGSVVTLTVKAKVTGCRENEMSDGEVERCVSLQITEIGSLAPDRGLFDHPSRVREGA